MRLVQTSIESHSTVKYGDINLLRMVFTIYCSLLVIFERIWILCTHCKKKITSTNWLKSKNPSIHFEGIYVPDNLYTRIFLICSFFMQKSFCDFKPQFSEVLNLKKMINDGSYCNQR